MSRATAVMPPVLLVAVTAASVFAGETTIPDTPSGRCAGALIRAFNVGDDAALRQFEVEHRAQATARRRPLDDRVAGWRNRYADWGKVGSSQCSDQRSA